jgi:hypothetical protein
MTYRTLPADGPSAATPGFLRPAREQNVGVDTRTRMAWWWHRQGLDETAGTPAQVLAATGWARSVGGANPYLSLFARAVAHTEAYVRDQLGDARSFSLDSPKSRAPRLAALRSVGAA